MSLYRLINKWFKNFLFLLLNIFYSDIGDRASILMYHSISNEDVFFTVRPKNFEKQLQYLKKKHYQIIFLSELINRLKKQEDISRCVCLTFDDGYLDNYNNAFPLLKKYQCSATIFLTTGRIGQIFIDQRKKKSFNMLTVDCIRTMRNSNLIEFMPHSASHPRFNKISYNEAINEMITSKQAVEQLCSKTADILAYPAGKFTQPVVDYLRNNHWRGAVTVQEGLIDKNNFDLYMLKRNSIDSTTNFIQFKGKISCAIDKYIQLKKIIKDHD